MARKLEELTLEELWQLFPIELTAHQDCWKAWYAEEEARLRDALQGAPLKEIFHVGSTAIDGIWAKPIVDILVEIDADADMAAVAQTIEAAGYRTMHREADRIDMNRGYTEEGFAERVFHLHLRREGDRDEVYFRDLLRESPELAGEYEELKLSLWKQYEHDRDAYTNAKTAFVTRFTQLAKLKRSRSANP